MKIKVTPRQEGPRMLNLELGTKSAELFHRLKDTYGVDRDDEVVRKALVLLDVAREFMDDSGVLTLGDGKKTQKVQMFRDDRLKDGQCR